MATEAAEIYDECFDKTGEGKIETSELRKFLQWCNFNPTVTETKGYIAEFDKNGTKFISRGDCMKLVDRRAGNPDSYEELLEACKHFDPAGGGKIRVDEMRLICSALGDKMDEALVDDMVKELDIEGFIKVESYSKTCFKMPLEEKEGKEKKGKGDGKKKKKK